MFALVSFLAVVALFPCRVQMCYIVIMIIHLSLRQKMIKVTSLRMQRDIKDFTKLNILNRVFFLNSSSSHQPDSRYDTSAPANLNEGL